MDDDLIDDLNLFELIDLGATQTPVLQKLKCTLQTQPQIWTTNYFERSYVVCPCGPELANAEPRVGATFHTLVNLPNSPEDEPTGWMLTPILAGFRCSHHQ